MWCLLFTYSIDTLVDVLFVLMLPFRIKRVFPVTPLFLLQLLKMPLFLSLYLCLSLCQFLFFSSDYLSLQLSLSHSPILSLTLLSIVSIIPYLHVYVSLTLYLSLFLSPSLCLSVPHFSGWNTKKLSSLLFPLPHIYICLFIMSYLSLSLYLPLLKTKRSNLLFPPRAHIYIKERSTV